MIVKIKKGTPCLFLRVSDFKRYNFIEEHLKVLKENNYVWLLKFGKNVKSDYLNKLKETNGGLILKSSPKNGNKFYYCLYDNVEVDDSLLYPDYYDEVFEHENYSIDDLIKTQSWFRIIKIIPIPEKELKKIETTSSHKLLCESALKCHQVSQIKAEVTEEINI